jgi:hypothetical protein
MLWRWLARKLQPHFAPNDGERDYTAYWRRTLCPHGVRYDSRQSCTECPYTGYGYGRSMDEGTRQ